MLIVCPKCFTQYAISDEIRIKKGQKFHCSACQNYFVLDQGDNRINEDESEVIPTVSSVMNAANQPAAPIIGAPIPTQQPMPTIPPVNESMSKPAFTAKAMPHPIPMPSPTVSVIPENQPTPMPKQQPQPTFVDEPALHGGEPRFEEPLSLLANEKPNPNARLDSIPEEFKPIQPVQKKKSSLLGTLFWLAVAGGICWGAYMQKDFLIEQLDSFILNQLDKNGSTSTPNARPRTTQAPASSQPVEQIQKPQSQDTVRSSGNLASTETDAQRDAPTVKPDKPQTRQQPQRDVVNQPAPVQNTQPVSSTTPQKAIKEETQEPAPEVKTDQTTVSSATKAPSEAFQIPNTQATSNEPLSDLKQLTESGLPPLSETENSLSTPQTVQNAPAESDEKPTLTPPATQTEQTETPATEEEPVPQVIREQAVVPSSFAPLAEQGTLSTSDIARILKIQEISYSIAPNEAGVMRLMIKGEIANTELKTLVIPELKAVVYNDEDMVVARKRIILTQPQIEGNSVQPFFSSVVPAPAQVSRVEVVFDE